MTSAWAKVRFWAVCGLTVAAWIGCFCRPAVHAAGQDSVANTAKAAEAALKVEGAVATPLTLTAEDLAKMPRATATLTADGTTVTYEGVLLYDILV
jgi:hypothetical protein